MDQRPSDEDYDRYVYLVDLFRRLDYNEEDIRGECPFIIKDVLFNAILCRANRDLLMIADLLEQDTSEVEDWVETTSRAISSQLWCPQCRQFESFDTVSGGLIHSATAAGFLPLFASTVSREQAQTPFETLDSIAFCALHQGNCFTVPNYDMTREDFDSRNYWRGPVWINLYNAIVIHGIVEMGIKSPVKEITNFFLKINYRIGDFSFSPETMEHGILRANARPPYKISPVFGRKDPRLVFSLKKMDPRIHFALVCESRSCAPIRFYDAGKIDEQLDMAAKNFVNSSEVIVFPEKNKIFLSQILDWYERDFEGKAGIRQFLLRYLDKDKK